jgi:hypothetical protein
VLETQKPKTMVRPFEIRDVSVIQRLTPLAHPLACELVAVDGVNPLREAVRAYLSGGRDHAVVLVARSSHHDLEAFGVMYVLPFINGEEEGHDGAAHRRAALVLMSPRPQSDALIETWMHLAQEFAVEATRRGVHHIVAEAPETGGEVEALQAAGFAPLIQQDVLKLAASPSLGTLPHVSGLREQTKDDEPFIKALHLRIAPKMTYQAEVSFDLLRATHGPDRGLGGGARWRAARACLDPTRQAQLWDARLVSSRSQQYRATRTVPRADPLAPARAPPGLPHPAPLPELVAAGVG